jgi:FkbM family methyltransferase
MPNLIDHGLRLLGRSGFPGTHRLVNGLRPAGLIAPRDVSFVTDFAGLRYGGSLSEYIDREIFYFGAYAPGELSFLDYAARRIAKDGDLNFFDVGANVGQHSLWMSSRARGVFAFEPSAAAVAQMTANLARNNITNVTVFPFALGDQSATAQLGTGMDHNAGSRSLLWTLDKAASETVEVRVGDEVFATHDLPPMDLLKMDVEGFERKVLTGLAQRLNRDRPVIMMELIGPADNKSGFASEADLRRTLYRDHLIFSLVGGRRWRLAPFDWNIEEMVCIPMEMAEEFDVRSDLAPR